MRPTPAAIVQNKLRRARTRACANLPRVVRCLTMALGLVSIEAHAQVDTSFEEQYKLIRAPKAFSSLGPDLAGDSINLYNGSLSFAQTDVSLRGNNTLPVSVGRRIAAGSSPLGLHAFGRWEIDIPHLHGTFASNALWAAAPTGARCSAFSDPPEAVGVNGTSAWDSHEFWHGNFIYVPGVGDQEMLLRADGTPGPGPLPSYPVVTSKFWYFSCLPALANPSTIFNGEGFLAISPDGTKYYFDWMAKFFAPGMTKSYPGPSYLTAPRESPAMQRSVRPAATSVNVGTLPGDDTPNQVANPTLPRNDVWLLPSKVVDKYGNTVFYTYDPAAPSHLLHIESPADNRNLWLTYNADGLVDTVSDGARSWQYGYTGTGAGAELTTVTLPDSSYWDFSQLGPLLGQVRYVNDGGCDALPMLGNGPISGSVKHPNGALIAFDLAPVIHGRSHFPRYCQELSTGDKLDIPRYFGTMSVTRKSVSGPGLPSMSWSYDYGPRNESWDTCTTCVSTKTVSVTDPTGAVSRHVFGNARDTNEGRPLGTETVSPDGTVLQSTSELYREVNAGPYVPFLGYSFVFGGDTELGTKLTPVYQRTTVQQGVNFIWQSSNYDAFARPQTTLKQSDLNPGRVETTSYYDHPGLWVIGQVAAVDANVVNSSAVKRMVQNTYDPSTASLLTTSRFGLLDKSLTYYGDGTTRTIADGKNQMTTISNYKRGIPRSIVHADGSTESAVVNDNGTIASVTDAAGNTTTFGYDAMFRLASISYPVAPGDPAWNQTTIALTQINTDEFGVPAGHWRQDIVMGQSRSNIVLDALWRPIFSQTYDLDNVAGSLGRTKNLYDHAGRTTFTSYLARDYVDTGVTTQYDALGRPTQVLTDSELGALASQTTYEPGFRKTVRDNRGNPSTYSYQAFDTPAEGAITGITAPEGLLVSINRDVFGKPGSITRSGGGSSATRSYVYDGYERLCKTIEPETGATLQQLDNANNVSWRAPGSSLTALTCDLASVPDAAKISFGYDTMNRLTSTNYGDGSAAISRDYWPDGQPKTVSSSGAVWTMNYNGRRLPTTQSLAFEGQTYNLSTVYNANGYPVQLTYPSATNAIATQSVSYAPDALGRPLQVGAYTTAISYYANGAIAGFTYGNGKVRTLTQNLRGLPETARDAGVLQDVYSYDQNGNVTAIADQMNAGPGGANTGRGMAYDGLNRLTVANSPGIWGGATYGYDTLDNLRTSTIAGRVSTYNYGARNLLDSLQSTAGGFTYNYAYDNRGNVTWRNNQSFGFDLGNRLTTAANLDTYVYDGFGRRVKTTSVDGTVMINVYSPAGQLLYTRRTGGPNPAQSTQYIYLHGHQIAEVKK
jgi:YD repeat-containing protein